MDSSPHAEEDFDLEMPYVWEDLTEDGRLLCDASLEDRDRRTGKLSCRRA